MEAIGTPKYKKKFEMTRRGKPITRDAPGSAGHLKIAKACMGGVVFQLGFYCFKISFDWICISF